MVAAAADLAVWILANTDVYKAIHNCVNLKHLRWQRYLLCLRFWFWFLNVRGRRHVIITTSLHNTATFRSPLEWNDMLQTTARQGIVRTDVVEDSLVVACRWCCVASDTALRRQRQTATSTKQVSSQ
eukprot:COSAG02_NODE_4192_length_5645_cov_2.530833_4_plen_127_part_00